MPDWCYNQLTIEGPSINEVLSAIAGENRAMDLQKIVPMPEAFIGTEAITKVDVALSCAKDDLSNCKDMPRVKNGEVTTTRQLAQTYGYDFEEVLAFGKKLLHNLEEYGAVTWHDWCCKNWGCKWNTRDSQVYEHLETSAIVRFDTAWDPPMPVIRVLARKFPDHLFKAYYDAESGPRGIIEIKGEEIIREEEFEFEDEYYELTSTDDCAVTTVHETDGAASIRDEDNIPI